MFSPAMSWVADDDGVVVVRRKDAGEVAAKGEKRQADEEGKRQIPRLRRARLDMYKMREPLAKAGLIYIDEPDVPIEMTLRCGHCLAAIPAPRR